VESGCTGYLEKPIDPETFAQAVESFLKVGPRGEQTP
jgi:CheY-like chemotaxis protein